jgi:hypothetical protein
MNLCPTNILSACLGVFICIFAGTANGVDVSPGGRMYRMNYDLTTYTLNVPFTSGEWTIIAGTENPLEIDTSF